MKTCKEISSKDLLRITKVAQKYEVLEKFYLNWYEESDLFSDLDNALFVTIRKTEPEVYDEAERLLERLREITVNAMTTATKEVQQFYQ